MTRKAPHRTASWTGVPQLAAAGGLDHHRRAGPPRQKSPQPDTQGALQPGEEQGGQADQQGVCPNEGQGQPQHLPPGAAHPHPVLEIDQHQALGQGKEAAGAGEGEPRTGDEDGLLRTDQDHHHGDDELDDQKGSP